MKKLSTKEILEKLKNDADYYGEFGRQFRSNSDISTLLTNPLALGLPQKPNINFLIGGYFHTAILEPEKLKKYRIIEVSKKGCWVNYVIQRKVLWFWYRVGFWDEFGNELIYTHLDDARAYIKEKTTKKEKVIINPFTDV